MNYYRFGFDHFTTAWRDFYLSICFLSSPFQVGFSFWRWHLSFGWVPKRNQGTYANAVQKAEPMAYYRLDEEFGRVRQDAERREREK